MMPFQVFLWHPEVPGSHNVIADAYGNCSSVSQCSKPTHVTVVDASLIGSGTVC